MHFLCTSVAIASFVVPVQFLDIPQQATYITIFVLDAIIGAASKQRQAVVHLVARVVCDYPFHNVL
jgi:hypothetical protein